MTQLGDVSGIGGDVVDASDPLLHRRVGSLWRPSELCSEYRSDTQLSPSPPLPVSVRNREVELVHPENTSQVISAHPDMEGVVTNVEPEPPLRIGGGPRRKGERDRVLDDLVNHDVGEAGGPPVTPCEGRRSPRTEILRTTTCTLGSPIHRTRMAEGDFRPRPCLVATFPLTFPPSDY
jgi:hypothetical protein